MRTLIVVFALLLLAMPADAQQPRRDDAPRPDTTDVPNVVGSSMSKTQVQLTPRVIGLSLSDASLLIVRAKLIPRIARVPSPDTALGSVIQQDPSPGARIRPDRTIDLQIAGVPQVVGLATDVAVARLERARLAATTSIREQTTGNDGTVLAQFPRAGQTVTPGTTVTLTVVRVVQPPFAMPELVGHSIANARRIIEESGLVLRGMEIANVEGRPDTAVGQSPVAGTIVRRGDQVTLTNGRPITTVEVPSVIRLRPDAASRVLDARGLRLVPAGARESEWPVGSVVGQRPRGGTRVTRGTSVSIDTAIAVVPPPPSLVDVPQFVGARITRVPRMPEARSLRIRARYSAPTRDSQDSVVVAQSLSAGARVPIGSAITLTVSQRQRARLASLRIEPESVSIVAHDSVRLTVVGVMSDGSRIAVAPSWAATMGRITGDGRYFATGETGRVVVAAAFGGFATTSIVRVEPPPRWWWWIPVIAVVVAGLGWALRRLFHRPPPPPTPPVPPLAFTYDFEAPSIETEITAAEGHGSNMSLVSYAGESVHVLEPAGVELFNEENTHG